MVGREETRAWLGKIAALLLLMALCCPRAWAQGNERPAPRWEAFTQGGGSFSTGISGSFVIGCTFTGTTSVVRERVSYKNVGRLFTGLRFSVTPNNVVEASYSYSPGRAKSVAPVPGCPAPPFEAKFTSHYLSFNYVRWLPPKGRLQPFVTAGAGPVFFEGGSGIQPKKALNLGGGFDFALSSRWLVRLDQRLFVSGATREGARASKGTIFNYAPTIGLAYRF